jgi:hypothetical protein
MSTNQRRRERYASDEDYRERRLRAAQEQREKVMREKERLRRLRGWEHIGTCPENEVVLLYDHYIWWPIVAHLGKDGQWHCKNYAGPDPKPTHWRPLPKVPLP